MYAVPTTATAKPSPSPGPGPGRPGPGPGPTRATTAVATAAAPPPRPELDVRQRLFRLVWQRPRWRFGPVGRHGGFSVVDVLEGQPIQAATIWGGVVGW